MAEPDDDLVRAGLARLSAALRVDPPPDELVAAVDTRIAMLPAPAPRSGWRLRVTRIADRLRRHRRAATAIAVALLLGVLAASPAGARIAQWLGIGAVQIQQEQSPATGPPDPADADGFTELSLDEARARVGLPLVMPAELGPPTRVLIGPGDAVVSTVWADGDPASPGSGAVRLDQMTGQPDFAAVKKYAQDVEFTQVDGQDAFWLRVPHPLVYVDPTGVERTERSRIAGPTLIWLDGAVTLRLEGVGTKERALQIARSVG
ncbi:MAG TPA: hypothetical protein VIU11_21590 [Nakamurella sp.]